MPEKFIISRILGQIAFRPTPEQAILAEKMAHLLLSREERPCLLLCGYAGTGKTSMMAGLVRAMAQMNMPFTLLAPTGRAAKVLSHYADMPAYTIHKWIYRGGRLATDGQHIEPLSLGENRERNHLFIVDEASMLSKELLDDLIRFVYCRIEDENGQLTDNGCRLLLLGDDAQLPPVGTGVSPALDADFLLGYGVSLITAHLTQVVRQALESGILSNATRLRENIHTPVPPMQLIQSTPDVHLLNGRDLVDCLEQSYRDVGPAQTLVLTRSNKRTNLYNQGIRGRILCKEDEVGNGDRLMLIRNNYFWTKEYDNLPFLANGDTFEVTRLRNFRELYGYRFCDAMLQSLDYEWEISAVLWLDTLTADTPEQCQDMLQDLYHKIAEDYPEIKNKRDLRDKILLSPYFNALQMRFAYAVTCHKAQGGQWKRVFIDPGALDMEGMTPSADGMRWMYTALTRATETVYLLKNTK